MFIQGRRQVKGENHEGVNWEHYHAVRSEREKRSAGQLEDMRKNQIQIGVSSVKEAVKYEEGSKI